MDKILESLSLDSSALYLMVVCSVFFLLAKITFFNRLKEILLIREQKTTSLDNEAEKNFKKAEELQVKYQGFVNKAYEEAQQNLNQEKEKLVQKTQAEITKAQSEASTFLKQKRIEIAKEIEGYESAIFSNADQLSDDLVKKIIQ